MLAESLVGLGGNASLLERGVVIRFCTARYEACFAARARELSPQIRSQKGGLANVTQANIHMS